MKKTNEKEIDDIVGVGDIVQIVNPHVFVRCGYPWTKEYVMRNVMTVEDGEKIDELVKHFKLDQTINGDIISPLSSYTDVWYTEAYDSIANAVALGILRKHNFGGSTRSIETKWDESIMGSNYYVIHRRVVKTGTRTLNSWYNEDGGGSVVYLEGEKTHVILTLTDYGEFPIDTLCGLNTFEIERKYIKKVHSET